VGNSCAEFICFKGLLPAVMKLSGTFVLILYVLLKGPQILLGLKVSVCFEVPQMYLFVISLKDCVECGLAQDRYRWRALANSIMNLRVP
jgi:hypothetical protein